MNKTGQIVYKTARKIIVAVIGSTVVILGIIMLVTPGPGVAAIIGGLAILALEFAWAKHWLERVKARSGEAIERANRSGWLQKIKQRFRRHP